MYGKQRRPYPWAALIVVNTYATCDLYLESL